MDNIYFYDGRKCARALDFLRDGVSDSAAIEAVIHSAKADERVWKDPVPYVRLSALPPRPHR